MGRQKKKKLETHFLEDLGVETKKSITAILLIGIAILLMLASRGLAGPAGDTIFKLLESLFGLGFYLLPLMSLAIGVLFLLTRERNFFGITFLGGILTVIFSLGFIDVVFPKLGGWIGSGIGYIEAPFGYTAALVLLGTLLVVSLLITFNASLRFTPRDKEDIEKEEEPVITEPDMPDDVNEEEEYEEDEEEEEDDEEEPVIVEDANPAPAPIKTPIITSEDYVAPPLSLLKSTAEKPTPGDIRSNANVIKRTLESFGVPVEMGEINIGPKVTRYTLKPAEGVKLTKITALNQDLSLALAAHPIRIEAPIPGKSLVGIEVPNKAAALVRLGSLMSYPDFMKIGPLGFPLGRDVSGEPIFIDIEKLPHLLVAGSTGSGKSITIHSILISLLFKNAPETLKLILIDPKRVELSAYDGIPHLIAPVITNAKKSIGVFRWAISEMDRRYEVLLSAGARDIKSYNKKGEEKMPYIVIVVDEMADLMASYGREVEGSIVRLAQMARATGIHLILSTQRPSVEVITGLIKANITGRLALQVASQIDSRTILDMAGAEKLLGGGDLLFISSEYSKPKRIQCSYLSEGEIKKVIEFIVKHNETLGPTGGETEDMTEMSEKTREIIFDDYENEDAEDDLFEEAVQIVKEAQKASASYLQRRLKIGYARAARLLDIMEDRGIIGPGDGAKPREVYLDKEGGEA